MRYLLIAAISFLACQSPANNTATGADSTTIAQEDTLHSKTPADTTSLNGGWYLIPVLAADTATGRVPELSFNLAEKKFTGNTGCNSMSGNFELNGATLIFNERIMLTKMACPGYNEQAFIESLLRTNNFKFENGVLILRFGETELSRWSRTKGNQPKTNRV